ncbi:MAG: L,D-transpeptidase family protein [Rhizobiaceae bacterium]
MRQILALVLTSAFLWSAPVVTVNQPVQAQSLFDALFPRAAERRRKRIEMMRQRERAYLRRKKIASGGLRVKAPRFKIYAPTTPTTIKLSSLSAAFAAHEASLASQTADQPLPVEPSQPTPLDTVPVGSDPIESNAQEVPAATDRSASSQDLSATDAIMTASADTDGATQEYGLPAGVQTAAVVDTTEEGLTPPAQHSLPSPPPPPEPPAARLSQGQEYLGRIRIKARKQLGDAVVDYYGDNPSFLWISGNGVISSKANDMLKVLADADSYGLRIEDYALPLMTIGDDASPDQLLRASMEFEFALTAAALRYMADARYGLVNPNRISGYHDFSNLNSDYQGNIKKLAESDDPAKFLLSQHPGEPVFEDLRQALLEAKRNAQGYDTIYIAPGTFIRPGQTNDQLENIIESVRRKASNTLLEDHFDVFSVDHGDGVYTDEVVAMIRDFQRSQDLKSDGIIGKNTIAKMRSGDPNLQVNKVLYAMERLRWHPDKFGDTHVFINQPAYRASFMRNGEATLSMRAIVGKPSNQTNFFYDKIEYVEYNPYWGVPRSILVNEMLPKLVNNPGYLDNLGYEVTTLNGRRISSSSVDWWNVGSDFPFNVRQPPGAKNALGELKIMFPNKHSIYMHDTPAKNLFSRDQRAFSHGCVRLADPRAMAAAVLGSDKVEVAYQLSDGRNKKQQLSREIPVYVAYFTAWPDADGKVQYYDDIYGRDEALGKAMQIERDTRERARDV